MRGSRRWVLARAGCCFIMREMVAAATCIVTAIGDFNNLSSYNRVSTESVDTRELSSGYEVT